MLAVAIIVFREVIEAGLIVGIVLAACQFYHGGRTLVALGVLAGLCGAGLLAGFTSVVANAFQGYGQEIFNASVLALAVGMLAWHQLVMAKQGRDLARELSTVSADVVAGRRPAFALLVLVAVAVLREGSEVVLFLYGIVVSDGGSAAQLLLGGALGLAAGVAISAVTYAGLVKIPARRLFAVTGALIALLAAGMAAQAIAFLEQAGLVAVLQSQLWDSSTILSDRDILGRVLHTLIGYNDRPTALQGLVYLLILAVFLLAPKLMARPSNPPPRAMAHTA